VPLFDKKMQYDFYMKLNYKMFPELLEEPDA
jgi:hypothetical protein